ncbi:MAG TPA: hypothetical protein VFQ80_11905, partial [Thermomicrobiales bacterium]|nr:hypothetical protein [Thermomicrobiales bacterium]
CRGHCSASPKVVALGGPIASAAPSCAERAPNAVSPPAVARAAIKSGRVHPATIVKSTTGERFAQPARDEATMARVSVLRHAAT